MPTLAQTYKLEPISTGAPGLPPAYAALIDSQGYRVVGPSGPWCEVWFRKSIPSGAKPSDAAIVLPIEQGTLLGILRFPAEGYDRRGQTVKAGVYTLRYSNYPVDGAHQGVAPQRDFALLTPLSADTDPNAKPSFDALVSASIKGVGTPHPAVLSLETPTAASLPSVNKEGDNDWSLSVKVGDLPLAIILVGKVEG
ncbi:MAG TPA: hypothetical protein VLY04_03550 [Bryobacteraceae bacterium]|nr:hypothetical protein [Bryobacteraceae bacterium]